MQTEITIKTECCCIQEHSKINKVLAIINTKNLAKLINVVGLTANPRKSKRNRITKSIHDTLRTSPEYFRFKSKGLLISTSHCIERERKRFTLSFENEDYEGVLDGGHNMLAVGLFILEEFFGDNATKELRGINNWDAFIELWGKHQHDLTEVLDIFEFEMPIEIIYPEKGYREAFPDLVFEISDARNNNVALDSGTKANHKGYYEILKESLDKEIEKDVAWKDGDPGRIQRDDIVVMSLIPLLALQASGKAKEGEGVPQINPSSLYSSKGKCVEIFSSFYEKYSDENGDITDPLFRSAISLVKDLPRLYDLIYQQFPRAYNEHSSRFGGMDCVYIYEKGKTGESYLKKPPLTRYYTYECDYKYPDGFIMPIFAALASLMKVENDTVKWKINDPRRFLEKNLSESVRLFVNTIKDLNYQPNVVGKSKSAYVSLTVMFEYLSNS